MGFFKNILDEVPNAVFVVDNMFRVQYANKMFKECFSQGYVALDEVGAVIGCANFEQGKCNSSENCKSCQIRSALTDCMFKGKMVFKRLVVKDIIQNNEKKSISIKMSIKPFFDDLRNCELYIVLIEDITKLTDQEDGERFINQKLLHDLKRAEKLQRQLLPPKQQILGVDIDYVFDQSFPIGGDFLGVYQIDEEHVGAYIADVSGHGMSSGMLTMFINEVYPVGRTNPKEILVTLKDKYSKYKFSSNEYITVLPIIIDVKNKNITFSNAGHITPMLLIRNGAVIEYSLNGTPVSNWFAQYNYDEATVQYCDGDRIVLFTDGIVDLKNVEGEFFGLSAFKKILSQDTKDIHILSKNIKGKIDFFAGSLEEKSDDIAVLILQL